MFSHSVWFLAQLPVSWHLAGAFTGQPFSVGHSVSSLTQAPISQRTGLLNGQVTLAKGHIKELYLQLPSPHLIVPDGHLERGLH